MASKNHETKLINCTEQVTAEVIENIEDIEEEQTSDYEYEITKERYKKIEVYTPVFKYEYDGKDYIRKGKKSKYSAAFDIGESVELKINPLSPYEFYEPNHDSYSSSSKIIIVMAGFFMIFGIYMLIKSKK